MLDLANKKGLFTFGLASFNKMANLIKGIDYLPQKPTYMLKLLKMVYSVESTKDELVAELTKDRELLSKLLEIPAIKNYYSNVNGDDLKNALQNLEKTFLQSSLEVDFARKFHKALSQKINLAEIDLWKQSLKSAVIAKSIAKWVGYSEPELAFMGALLSEVPLMVLEQEEGVLKAKVEEKISQGMTMKEAELVVYGFDHGEFGVRLFRHLGLPIEIQELVAVDMSEELCKPKYLQLLKIVNFAKFIANCFCDKTQSPSSIWNDSQKSMKNLALEITPEQWGNKISLLFVKSVEFEMSVVS